MKTYKETMNQLQKRGYRITKTRKGILEIFWKKKKPLPASDIRDCLQKKSIVVNRTTIYRELEFLLKEGVISDVLMGDGKRYFEIIADHHHHLICIQCKDVKDVVLRSEFEREEKRVEREKRFKILRHSLEFFGLCERCR